MIDPGQAGGMDHQHLLQEGGEVAMRPVWIVTAVIFAAALAVTGCAAHFTVAPADRPGWYMTVLNDCG